MELAFYIASIIAIFTTLMVITRANGVHALLYLIVSLLSVAFIFFMLGAPFMAALEVIIYAGAIMVLFIFVIMMLNLGKKGAKRERQLMSPGMWVGPGIFALILLGELIYVIQGGEFEQFQRQVVGPAAVGESLYHSYVLGVELAALLLMAGIVGAYHLGRRKKEAVHRYLREEENQEDTA
jgi:NADH-quinone oxidoreductase subunit J